MPRSNKDQDLRFKEVIHFLKNSDQKYARKKYHPNTSESERNGIRKIASNFRYYESDDKLWYKVKNDKPRLVVRGVEERQRILEECHVDTTVRHMGETKMRIAINEQYYWQTIVQDIKTYIGRCTHKNCQSRKRAKPPDCDHDDESYKRVRPPEITEKNMDDIMRKCQGKVSPGILTCLEASLDRDGQMDLLSQAISESGIDCGSLKEDSTNFSDASVCNIPLPVIDEEQKFIPEFQIDDATSIGDVVGESIGLVGMQDVNLEDLITGGMDLYKDHRRNIKFHRETASNGNWIEETTNPTSDLSSCSFLTIDSTQMGQLGLVSHVGIRNESNENMAISPGVASPTYTIKDTKGPLEPPWKNIKLDAAVSSDISMENTVFLEAEENSKLSNFYQSYNPMDTSNKLWEPGENSKTAQTSWCPPIKPRRVIKIPQRNTAEDTGQLDVALLTLSRDPDVGPVIHIDDDSYDDIDDGFLKYLSLE